MDHLNVSEMLLKPCEAMEAGVTKSTTKLDVEQMRRFPWELFGRRLVIGQYSGTMKYTNLYVDKEVEQR